MLMITHKTSDEVDSFVWIIPIILGILIRPYIVRYVHQVTYKVYREVSLVSLFMVFGAIGCYIVGLSCDMQGKSRVYMFLFSCSEEFSLVRLVGLLWTSVFNFVNFLQPKLKKVMKKWGNKKRRKMRRENKLSLTKRKIFLSLDYCLDT